MNATIKMFGRTYTKADACEHGDGSGWGSVGQANTKWIRQNMRCLELSVRTEEDPQKTVDGELDKGAIVQAIIFLGDYSSEWVYLLTAGNADVITAGDVDDASDEAADAADREDAAVQGPKDAYELLRKSAVIDADLIDEVEEEWRLAFRKEALADVIGRNIEGDSREVNSYIEELSEEEAAALWYTVEMNGRAEWVYEYNQAFLRNADECSVLIIERIREELRALDAAAAGEGWTLISDNPDDPTEWGYCAPGGRPDKWVSYRWQAAARAAGDVSLVVMQVRLLP